MALGKTSHSKEDVLWLEPALVPQNDVIKNKKSLWKTEKGNVSLPDTHPVSWTGLFDWFVVLLLLNRSMKYFMNS